MSRRLTPMGALGRGLVAGLAGTAAMTAYQTAVAMRRGSSLREAVAPPPPDRWSEAPAPAQVGQRFVKGMFRRDLPAEDAPVLTNAVHWAYGTGWGGLYGLAAASLRANPVLEGVGFGSTVFASGYAALPAMGIYQPPWKYDGKTLGVDLSYHLVYGVTTSLVFWALER